MNPTIQKTDGGYNFELLHDMHGYPSRVHITEIAGHHTWDFTQYPILALAKAFLEQPEPAPNPLTKGERLHHLISEIQALCPPGQTYESWLFCLLTTFGIPGSQPPVPMPPKVPEV